MKLSDTVKSLVSDLDSGKISENLFNAKLIVVMRKHHIKTTREAMKSELPLPSRMGVARKTSRTLNLR